MTQLSERGENWEKLVARLTAVEMQADKITLKEAAKKGMMGAYYARAIDLAEGAVNLMRHSKEGYYKDSSDEAIATIIMEAANERKTKQE